CLYTVPGGSVLRMRKPFESYIPSAVSVRPVVLVGSAVAVRAASVRFAAPLRFAGPSRSAASVPFAVLVAAVGAAVVLAAPDPGPYVVAFADGSPGLHGLVADARADAVAVRAVRPDVVTTHAGTRAQLTSAA